MKIGLAVIASLAIFSAAGMASAGTPSEVGYASGSLAVGDLMTGKLDRAERILAAQSAEDARDPARLINLGIVYARSGRTEQARASFAAARDTTDETLVLSDGREASSRVVAQQQLAMLGQATMAAR